VTDFGLTMLERGWAVLTPPRAQELSSYPLEVVSGSVACRVALDSVGGRHLLIPVNEETVSVDPKTAVLGLAVRKLRFGSSAATYVDVSCKEGDVFLQFDQVVTDVLEAVADSSRPASAAIDTVIRWRRLFQNILVRGLSHQAKLGLFAELAVLTSLIEAQPNFPVNNWRGPLQEPHDFEALSRCIEVKALSVAADDIVVHGLDQLGTHDNRPLDLALLRVVEDANGRTISELVDQLLGVVASRTDLRQLLAAVGWSTDSAQSDVDAFSIDEVFRVVVGADTPRVVNTSLANGSLPHGIEGLRYRVRLNALLPLSTGASLANIAEEAVR
jgi:hypothetical protein